MREEKTMKIFKDALKNGLQLPKSKCSKEANITNDPNYCPYHHLIGHLKED